MTNPSRNADWSLAENQSDDFVLEEDANFGLGELEGVPPFDGEEPPRPANEGHVALEDDPFGLTTQAAPPHYLAARDEAKTTEQPVPRITIHACCDRHEIADTIAGIAADRRMARAEINVEQGGIDAAIARFSAQASPNLLIIDTQVQGQAMLHGLDRLAQVIEEGTKVVIVGAVNDSRLFRELMARGVSEYIVPPIQPGGSPGSTP